MTTMLEARERARQELENKITRGTAERRDFEYLRDLYSSDLFVDPVARETAIRFARYMQGRWGHRDYGRALLAVFQPTEVQIQPETYTAPESITALASPEYVRSILNRMTRKNQDINRQIREREQIENLLARKNEEIQRSERERSIMAARSMFDLTVFMAEKERERREIAERENQLYTSALVAMIESINPEHIPEQSREHYERLRAGLQEAQEETRTSERRQQ